MYHILGIFSNHVLMCVCVCVWVFVFGCVCVCVMVKLSQGELRNITMFVRIVCDRMLVGKVCIATSSLVQEQLKLCDAPQHANSC